MGGKQGKGKELTRVKGIILCVFFICFDQSKENLIELGVRWGGVKDGVSEETMLT